MPTVPLSIGTDPVLIANISQIDEFLDIIIQNLSANVVYVGSDNTVATDTGISVAANATHVDDSRGEPVWLIASGANSDVRIQYYRYRWVNGAKVRV